MSLESLVNVIEYSRMIVESLWNEENVQKLRVEPEPEASESLRNSESGFKLSFKLKFDDNLYGQVHYHYHSPQTCRMPSDQSRALLSLSYGERAERHSNPSAKALLETMERKRSNLCVSVDVSRKDKFLQVIEAVGPYACLIKAFVSVD